MRPEEGDRFGDKFGSSESISNQGASQRVPALLSCLFRDLSELSKAQPTGALRRELSEAAVKPP